MQAYVNLSPANTTMQFASIPLSLLSTKASLSSRSIHSEKLPFFQKAPNVDFACIARIEGGGISTRQIWQVLPSFKVYSVQKVGAYFRELTVHALVPKFLHYSVMPALHPLIMHFAWVYTTRDTIFVDTSCLIMQTENHTLVETIFSSDLMSIFLCFNASKYTRMQG